MSNTKTLYIKKQREYMIILYSILVKFSHFKIIRVIHYFESQLGKLGNSRKIHGVEPIQPITLPFFFTKSMKDWPLK